MVRGGEQRCDEARPRPTPALAQVPPLSAPSSLSQQPWPRSRSAESGQFQSPSTRQARAPRADLALPLSSSPLLLTSSRSTTRPRRAPPVLPTCVARTSSTLECVPLHDPVPSSHADSPAPLPLAGGQGPPRPALLVPQLPVPGRDPQPLRLQARPHRRRKVRPPRSLTLPPLARLRGLTSRSTTPAERRPA